MRLANVNEKIHSIMGISLEQVKEYCPAARYTPNKAASEEFILKNGGRPGSKSRGDVPFFESMARVRAAIGGNRSAKSAKMVMECGAASVGCRPWYDPKSPWFTKGLPSFNRSKAVRIRFVVSNYRVQVPEIMEEIKKWWPRDWWKVSAKNDNGQPAELTWFEGQAVWYFMSHKQNTDDFEGIETDLVAWNEPPPRDKYVALHRGLVSTGGRSLIGATPLSKSDWFWEEVITPNEDGKNPEVLITYHSIWDNSSENGGCPEQYAKNIRLYLEEVNDPDERLAREHGHPMHLAGRVLNGMGDKNLVDPFDLPLECYIVAAIDPAGARPFAGMHCAYLWNKDDMVDKDLKWEGHFFDETYIPQSARDLGLFCRTWMAKEKGEWEDTPFHPVQSAYTQIDPIANEAQKADARSRTMAQILFDDYGIKTQSADRRGKRGRLLQYNTRFKERNYKVWKNCRRFLDEAKRWSWDPDSPKLTSGPDDLQDCGTYIDATNPPAHLPNSGDTMTGGIWVPGQEDSTGFAELDRAREAQRWKYMAKHGLRPE